MYDILSGSLSLTRANARSFPVHAMQNYAINNKLTPFISMQNHYNLIYREEEREMFPTLKHLGVGAIPWSPLARGLTTRPVGAETTRTGSDRMVKGYNYGEGTKKIISACVFSSRQCGHLTNDLMGVLVLNPSRRSAV
jgi:aryl-alcohol dehydrogenase-like predicted oxidoreductase